MIKTVSLLGDVEKRVASIQDDVFNRKKRREEATEFRDRLKNSSNQKEKMLKLFSDVKKSAEKIEREQNSLEIIQKMEEVVKLINEVNIWCENNSLKDFNKELLDLVSNFGVFIIHQYHLSRYHFEATKVNSAVDNEIKEIYNQEVLRLSNLREIIKEFPLKFTEEIPTFQLKLVNNSELGNPERILLFVKSYLHHISEIDKEIKKKIEKLLNHLTPSHTQFQIFFVTNDVKKLLQSEIKKKEEMVSSTQPVDENPRIRELEDKLTKIYEDYRVLRALYDDEINQKKNNFEDEWENIQSNESETLKLEIERIKNSYEALDKVKRELEKSEKEKRGIIEDLKVSLEQEKIKNEKLNQYYNEEEEKKNEVTNEIMTLRSECEKLLELVKIKEISIEELNRKYRDTSLEESSIKQEKMSLKNELEEKSLLISQLDKDKMEANSRLEELSNKLDLVNVEKQKLLLDFQKMETELKNKEEILQDEIRKKLSTIEENLELEKKISEQLHQLQELQLNYSDLEKTNKSLLEKATDLKELSNKYSDEKNRTLSEMKDLYEKLIRITLSKHIIVKKLEKEHQEYLKRSNEELVKLRNDLQDTYNSKLLLEEYDNSKVCFGKPKIDEIYLFIRDQDKKKFLILHPNFRKEVYTADLNNHDSLRNKLKDSDWFLGNIVEINPNTLAPNYFDVTCSLVDQSSHGLMNLFT